LMWAAGIPVQDAPTNPDPARVLNLSLGAVAPCIPTAQAAIDAVVYSASATVVVAAGNGNIDAANFLPANCQNVIAVAALTRDGKKASYSNFGSVIDIAAPGGDLALGPTEGVISTVNAGRTTPGAAAFGVKNGTSMATAHVSAVVGMMSAWNYYTADQLEDMLKFQTRQGTGPCEFPKCIRAINDYAAVLEAFSHQGVPYYE
jgi:serine protease